ncbi:uncharacterized protein LOC119092341 [Pollicipes pollicipes]|uniref:uncharacterized protein LOC119092341 n=1 Tax=Pollicipes pollicipes TaxID=41117 RepID=UPI0018849DA8|nr:uncharacterized protein LOC119092341 [Pollicipes pollicipes]
MKTTPPTINCKLARQLCEKDRACQSITSMIPRLCGQELVSCSTVTVTKCRAALRTLVAFQFFQPTCLCKEPRLDPECNKYRNLVFDHPCFSVKLKDKDPFPIHALPTCGYALGACLQRSKCSYMYENYVNACRFEGDTCHMSNSSACADAWNQLKLTPVFGCICPNLHEENCEKIFKTVHNNPCILDGLGGANASRRRVDPLLVAPLFNMSSERPQPSSMERTLHGHHYEQGHSSIPGRHQTITHHHVTGVTSVPGDDVFQSSCHTALDNCLQDDRCSARLEPVLADCDETACSRHMCMQRLQQFYAQADSVLVMDAAFCVCRRSADGDGRCLRAMERLHPTCARQPESSAVPGCDSVAHRCQRRPDAGCRLRLEQYEQACAVDALTQRCAGPTADCRRALLAVLGTQLHSRCACRGSSAAAQHSCQDWERLLWANPCVALSQREHHQLRWGAIHGGAAVSRTTSPPVEATSAHGDPRPNPGLRPDFRRPAATTPSSTAPPAPPTTTTRGATVGRRPQPYCTARKQGTVVDHIPVGSGIRYYVQDESPDKYRVQRDCSELCMCHGRHRLVCNVLDCVEKKSCQADLAVYPHGAARLLPFREGCICHHGDFVCMRPSADDYTLPFGVFLFLGYSKTDEDALFPYTHKRVKDHVAEELEHLLELTMTKRGMRLQDWPCSLSVKQHFQSSNNLIIQAKLDEVEKSYNQSINQRLLNREKAKCTKPLRDISFMVNTASQRFLSHPLLSVFKMADLEVTIPDMSAAGGRRPSWAQLVPVLRLPVWPPPSSPARSAGVLAMRRHDVL